jgi:uncharacterized protein (DUF1800 family)
MNRLDFADARHLVSRTGIGVEWKNVNALVGMTMPVAVETIVRNRHAQPPPFRAMQPWRHMSVLRKDMRRQHQLMKTVKGERIALQIWWTNHLLRTQSPFLERMTLFWHNMFPSTMGTVMSGDLVYQQNLMLRKYALGNFRNLLQAVAKDPAMLVYLNGNNNVKAEPNENFAREALELFTIGQGYGQKDVHDSARAFTGWSVNNQNGRFIYRPEQHDFGMKTILGRSGKHTGEVALSIMLEQPRTAERLAKRMWHEFVSIANPNPHVIKRWANVFIHSRYNIETLVKTVLMSDEFWAATNRGGLIKSPIDLVIGTLRTLPYAASRNDLPHQLKLLGQELFEQPSVKGWMGAEEWMSSQALLLRSDILRNFARGNLGNRKSGVEQALPTISRQEMTSWLLAIPALKAPPEKRGKQRFVRALVLDPAYQVL